MAISEESQAKSAFVTPLSKCEFIHCPFGLAKVPAYFQCHVFEVLKSLQFCFQLS